MTHSNRPQVNAILHTLRGEAFRRQLNLTGNRRPPVQSGGPSLPPSLYSSEVTLSGIDKLPPNDVSTNTQIPGPPPPRSWITSASVTPKHTDPSSPEWRSNALSFMFHHSPCSSKVYHNPSSAIPSFFHLCLHTILEQFGGIPLDMYRDIPRHVLREYVRHGVIHQLISKEEMLQIWNVDKAKAIDGELLVSGSITTPALSRNTDLSDSVIEDWDAEENNNDHFYRGKIDTPPPMHTFIALSATFYYSHIQLLPTSITHLALINIQKISLYWLPAQLPSLVVLDLSYNSWINDAHALAVNWRKWVDLEAVALRGCPICESQIKLIGQEISSGRLLEVEIVIESPGFL